MKHKTKDNNENKKEAVQNNLKTVLNAAGEDDEIIFNKYFNAPYTSKIKDSEKINLNTGSLEFKSTDLSLKGRNGLDLNITMRYDSSLAKLYSEKYNVSTNLKYTLIHRKITCIEYTNGKTVITNISPWEQQGVYNSYGEAWSRAYTEGIKYGGSAVYDNVTKSKYFQDTTETKVTYTQTDDSPIVSQNPSYVYVPNSIWVSGDGYMGSIAHQSDRVKSDTGYRKEQYQFYPKAKYRYVREVITQHIYGGTLNKTVREQVGNQYTYYETKIDSVTSKKYINQISGDTYNELHNCLGSGWALGFSSVEIDGDNKYMHLSTGEVYKVNITSSDTDANLEQYPLNDIRFENDNGSYSNGIKASQYVLIHKDGIKEYFSDDGRLLSIIDRLGNTIKFEHTTISGHPVISKITDTTGRIVEIAYQASGDNKEVTITAPNKATLKYILEPILGGSGEYRLSKKIDMQNRETKYSYNIDSGMFTFFSKEGRNTENKYVNLTEIHYSTGACSKYSYEKTVGNMGNRGSQEYFRIKTRQDIDDGKSYNEKTYNYSGNYTGYPNFSDPNSLSAEFTYGVDVTDAYMSKTSYTFNNTHMKSKEVIKDKDSILRRSTDYVYNTNKLPVKVISRTYNKITGQYLEKVKNYAYDLNNFGDIVGYWDSQNDRDSNNLPTNDEHKTTYTYNSSYHFMTSKIYKKDENTTIREEMTPYSDNKFVECKKVFENEFLKKQTQYLYDVYGNITEERKYLDNWSDFITDKYDYSDNDPERNGKLDGVYLTRKWVEEVKNADGGLVDAKSGNSAGVVDEVNKYDIIGNLIEKQDGMGYKTSYQYDTIGRLCAETNDDGASKKLDYNDSENSIVVTDENGDSIKCDYDGFGNLMYKQDVKTAEVLKQYEYDLEFRLAKESSYNNKNITTYRYTEDGRLLHKETRNNEGTLLNAESYDYEDAFGSGAYSKTTKIIEGDEKSPSIKDVTYENKYGFVEKQGKVHNGVEQLNTFKYDYMGNKTEQKSTRAYDESWTEPYTKKYQYNYKGDIIKEYNILGDCVTHEYDSQGRVKRITDVKGNKAATAYYTTYEYDNLGRLIKEVIPFEEVSGTRYYTTKKHYYDRNKNIIRECVTINKPGEEETYNRIDFEYNNRNKLAKVTTYDDGEPENYTQFYYDAAGNKVRMYTGLSKPLTINGLDSAVSNGDSEYSVTKYGYDRFGNLSSMIDALGNKETYNYDLNGNKVQQIDRNGNIMDFDYDGMGRVLKKSVTTPDGQGNKSYSYTYTLTGKLLSSSGDSVNTTFTYDDRGNKISESMTNGIIKEYGYDSSDNKISFIMKQNGTAKTDTAYRYDKMNRLEQVSEAGQMKATYAYDDNGNRKTLTCGNGNTTTYQYNLANKLKILTNSNNDIKLSEYSYNYYLDGNQESKNESTKNKVTEYLYDGLRRLKSETETESGISASATDYTYDDYNNRATMTKDGVQTSYEYDLNSRLKAETVVSGEITEITKYGYDNNGNQIFKATETTKPQETGDSVSLSVSQLGLSGDEKVRLNEYDGFNQLVKVIYGDMTSTYDYNGDGLRNSKTVNGTNVNHIWDGKQMTMELSSQGAIVNRYLRGTNLISTEDGTGTERYYLYNGHGDVVQLTDRVGTVTKTYDYDAFGVDKNPDPEDTNVFRYCGQYFDVETGTYYLQARYYDPAIGRFISSDSYLGKDNDPLSLNLYTYCSNNPIMYVDEDGHIAILATMAIGALAGAVISAGVSAFVQYRMNGYINWRDVGIAAGAGAISGALAGSGVGLGYAIAGNGLISSGQYYITQRLNNQAITRSGMVGSFAVGAIAGRIGGEGAYPAVSNALRPLESRVVYNSRGIITGFANRSQDVIKYLYQPEVTSQLFRLTGVNMLRTTAATGFSYAPSAIPSTWRNLVYSNSY